ncbi:MAG: radical SAM protein [Lachnospiraceae bacterium]|nr:radical SAM protein [Lachnospiraceae bacterium]
MKVTMILPAIGKKPDEKYLRSWLMEPLTIAVLNTLLPKDVEREFFDDRIESIDYETDTDVVLITVETYTAKRAYYISEQFRKRGKKVIMGGYHATLVPDEVKEHCDAIMINNCGENLRLLLDDIKNDNLKKEYIGKPCIDYKKADRSIYAKKMKKYLPVSLVETGRGCFHNCEFCSIAKYYDSGYIHRDVSDIIEEMRSCKHKLFFLVDDSIFSNKSFARELFKEIKKLKVTWTTQITLDIAKDEEMLRLMKDSGCEMVLIGFESINSGNLKQMNKEWTARLGERDELIELIHSVGISIYASFVFGFDEDTEESFQRTLEFTKKHQFFVIAFNHLLTFPGTPTYRTFQDEGRLICDKWWLQEGYTFGTISFVPKSVSAEELRALCRKYKTEFFRFSSILSRGITCFKRTKKPYINFAYWYINILFHFEVDKRIGIPVGENLEEIKK